MRPVDLAVRLEWVAAAAAAIIFYAMSGVSWWLFALLILAPDLSMLGYLAGPRAGAIAYNAAGSCARRQAPRQFNGHGDSADLDRPHRHRPRAWLWLEVVHWFSGHPSRAHRAPWRSFRQTQFLTFSPG